MIHILDEHCSKILNTESSGKRNNTGGGEAEYVKELCKDLQLLQRGSGVTTRQEYAESLAVSRGNAREERQCNELMVDKRANRTSKASANISILKKK